MSEPQVPTTPTAPQKKGLGPLGWIAIGCVALLVIAAIGFTTCTAIVGKKVKNMAEDAAENPALAAAKMAVRLNPELELVEADDEKITVRNVKTGETMTLDLEDAAQGRIRFETDGKEVEIDAAGDEEGGIITMRGEGDEETLSIGGGDLDDLPGWVPVHPDATGTLPYLMTSGDEINGNYAFETDSKDDAVEFFVEKLEAMGFVVERTDMSGPQGSVTMLSARSEETSNQVIVNVSTDDGGAATGSVTFSGTR